MAPPRSTSARRRFLLGCVLGALPAVAVFAWLLAAGNADLLIRESFGGNFYDAQATSLMDGRWDMPARVVGIDGFRVDSKYYMYFGIWPSILRMPVLLFSDSLSGRLTKPSMLIAFVIILVGVGALQWRVRTLLRPGHGCNRSEALLAGVVVFAIGCGTTALFLGSRANVYHEAIIWGIAWSLLAYERIIAFIQRPTRGSLAAAGVFATLAMLSRVSVGAGPVIALGLVAAIELVRIVRRRRDSERDHGAGRSLVSWIDQAGVCEPSGRRWLLAATIATLVPVMAYAWMNYSRFGAPFGIPWRSQVIATISADHRAMLDANNGTLFGVKLIPTTLLQVVRPDAIGFSPVFPWLTLQRFPTLVLGDVVFNKLDFTTSVTASMPALVVLGGLGGLAVIWTRVAHTRDVAALRIPLLGAALATVVALAFTFVAARYLGDWVPLLAIAALVGLEVLLRRREDTRRRGRWNAALGFVAVLALFGVWANFSLGLLFQRLYDPPDWDLRAEMIALQYDIAGALGSGSPDLVHSRRLPSGPGRAGTTWIAGRCRAMYWSNGREWVPVQGKQAGGWVRLRADFADVSGEWAPLVAFGPPGRQDVVSVLRESGGLRFGFSRATADGALVRRTGLALRKPRPGMNDVEVLADRMNRSLLVRLNGRFVLAYRPAPPSGQPLRVVPGPVVVGRATSGGLPVFPGEVRRLPPDVLECKEVLRRAEAT